MAWQHIRISRFGGPDVLDLVTEQDLPQPGPGNVRIKVLAAGTGFTDTFIRAGRYPDFKGPLPFTPGYDLVGEVEAVGAGVTTLAVGQRVADLCVVGGYTQYAIRPAAALVAIPNGLDPAEAVCIPLAYTTAYQMLTRFMTLKQGNTILVIGASGSVGTAMLDLARGMGLSAIGTCSARNMALVESYGATAIDYHTSDFVARVRHIAHGKGGDAGVDAAFDAIGGAHFSRSFAALAKAGLLVGYGSQTMALGDEGVMAAGLGLVRLKAWALFSRFLEGRSAAWYSITERRKAHPIEFAEDMIALFAMLKTGAIHPVVNRQAPLECRC